MTNSQRFNLTSGGILDKLLTVSVPIIGTQLMLMGYNLVDMFLLGRVGPDAVAASGSAGMYMWLANGLMLIGRMGAEIGVAQNKGRGRMDNARVFSQNALFLAAVTGSAYALVCILFPEALTRFLNIQEPHVAAETANYLRIIGFGFPFSFLASCIAGSFTGAGNSRAPFFVNAAGLAVNAVLDPLFIFTLGLGVSGAAIATVIAQGLAFVLSLLWLLRKADRPFASHPLFERPAPDVIRAILRWSVPVSLENVLFCFCTMVVSRYIASYGANAITVFRVGSQVESLCWLICLGFSSGLTTFVGQNYGAGRWSRIRSCFRVALAALMAWNIAASILFLTAGGYIIRLFVPDPRIVTMGAEYLMILASCQVFFCLESIAAGCFRGLGKTAPPSIASISANILRIPTVHFLSGSSMGLTGVWWGITASAILRGIAAFLWYLLYARTRPKGDERPPSDTESVRRKSVRIYDVENH